MDVAQLQDRLSEKERFVQGLSKQTDLIALAASGDKSVDDKAAVLLAAVKERDTQIHRLSHAHSLQVKRIQKLETQLASLSASSGFSSNAAATTTVSNAALSEPLPSVREDPSETKEQSSQPSQQVKEQVVQAPQQQKQSEAHGSPFQPLTAAIAAGDLNRVAPSTPSTPAHEGKKDSLSRVREEDSPASGGGLGSPSMARKTRHRRGSSVGESPVIRTPDNRRLTSAEAGTPQETPQEGKSEAEASASAQKADPKLQTLVERRKQARRAQSQQLPNKSMSAVQLQRQASQQDVGDGPNGTPTASTSETTGEKKLVTPPPWQLKKMMEGVEKRSSLPPAVVVGTPVAVTTSGAKGSPATTAPIFGLKSHSAVTALPGVAAAAAAASPLPSKIDKSTSPRRSLGPAVVNAVLSTPAALPGAGSAIPGGGADSVKIKGGGDGPDSTSGSSVEMGSGASSVIEDSESSAEGFTNNELQLARTLHPMGLPTQGLVRLPVKRISAETVASQSTSAPTGDSSATAEFCVNAPDAGQLQQQQQQQQQPFTSSSSAPSSQLLAVPQTQSPSHAPPHGHSGPLVLPKRGDAHEPVRRLGSKSADQWAESAAKARMALSKSHDPSLPLEAVLPDPKETKNSSGPIAIKFAGLSKDEGDEGEGEGEGDAEAEGDEQDSNKDNAEAGNVVATSGDALHVTPSFEGLAEKIEGLSTSAGKKSGAPLGRKSSQGSSVGGIPGARATNHATRFQEQLLEQLRAEQFELLKTIKEMRDEAEIQELRMAQLMERIRNSEEIIDDKTAECQQQKLIIRELRKESSALKSKVEALESQTRSAAVVAGPGQAMVSLSSVAQVSSISTSSAASSPPYRGKRLSFSALTNAGSLRKSDDGSVGSVAEEEGLDSPGGTDGGPGKQFVLSDDDGSDAEDAKAGADKAEGAGASGNAHSSTTTSGGSDGNNGAGSGGGGASAQRRKQMAEMAKTIARLEDDLRKEVIYRQALEKQVTTMQQRHSVEELDMQRKHSEELESVIREAERTKVELLRAVSDGSKQVDSLQKKLLEQERKLDSRTKELSRLRAAANGSSASMSPPITTLMDQRDLGSVLDTELELVQKELDDRATEVVAMRKKLTDAEEARDAALAKVDVLKSGLSQVDRELKALRLQFAKAKSGSTGLAMSGGGMSEGGAGATVVVAASSPTARATSAFPSAATSASSPSSVGGLHSAEEMLAHQEVLVNMTRELEALRREKAAALSLRDCVAQRLESELYRERQLRSQLRDRLLRAARGGTLERDGLLDVETELAECRQELFHAVGVAAKLTATGARGQVCNLDLSSLWEQAQQEGVHWRYYRAWLQRHVDKAIGVAADRKSGGTGGGNSPPGSTRSSAAGGAGGGGPAMHSASAPSSSPAAKAADDFSAFSSPQTRSKLPQQTASIPGGKVALGGLDKFE